MKAKGIWASLLCCIMVLCSLPLASATEPEPVTITFFSDNPDRSVKEGQIEDYCIEEYMKAYPHVTIKKEILENSVYKQKFMAYAASNELPDVMLMYAYPAFLGPLVESGAIAKLNKDDYADYAFYPSALDQYTVDGELYGLPRISQVFTVYYNKKIFAEAGVEIPQTFEELVEVAKTLRVQGIQPCAVTGKEKWQLLSLMNNLFIQLVPEYASMVMDLANRNITFAEVPGFLKAAEKYKELMDIGFYQDSFVSADYGTARNAFIQGQTAMFYMNSTEMGFQAETDLPEEFRENVSCFPFPVFAESDSKITDLHGSFAIGYSVANNANAENAIHFLNFMLDPDMSTKYAWQVAGISTAQSMLDYVTGDETQLQQEVLGMFRNATSLSGTPFYESAAPSFKTDAQTIVQTLAAGMITPEMFIRQLDEAMDYAAQQSE